MIAGNKVHFVSLGCARNLVDTEVMLTIVLRAGYQVTDQVGDADAIVVNTCGFLESARAESSETIRQLLEEKKSSAKLIVAGCMVQKEGGQLKERFPQIHYLIGSGDMEKILEAITSSEAGAAVTSARSYLEWGEVPRQISTPKHYAYLKIAEGCAKACAFCIIPKIKGPLRSKSQEQVVREMRALLSQGVKEVILIAQDLGDYGKERREKNGLEALLETLLQEKGDFWLRLLYLYPDEITPELIALLERDKRLCRYLDMPIQHISDPLLKAMRRKTSSAHIRKTLAELRRRLPDIVIRTSLMVGFPGETEEHFQELLDFVQEAELDNVGIFKFSLEKEAHAASLPNQVQEEVKQERFERLARLQADVALRKNRRYIGQRLKVLIDGLHPDSPLLVCGRFYGQCPEIDGQVIINEASRAVDRIGALVEVEITEVAGYDLIGRALAPQRASSKLALVNQ